MDEREREVSRQLTPPRPSYRVSDAPPDRLYAERTHAFEFERTVSRLMEMQVEDYRGAPSDVTRTPGVGIPAKGS